jgi:hypothetical protein
VQKPEGNISERPTDWPADGRFLMYTRFQAATTQLWTVSDPLDAAKRKAAPYLETPYVTTHRQFSPGPGGAPRWVAYTSDESRKGREIYVQSFPLGGGKFQVSTGGGSQPRWRRDGKELYYLAADGKLMAVDVETAPKFEAGTPHALFDSRISNTSSYSFSYDASPDGQRFLIISPRQGESNTPAAITVVMNWLAGAKR